MAIITCWAVKGGSGTTVVVAGIALAAPGGVLVDLAGELPAALGVAEPAGQGLAEWFASDAPPSALADLAVEVGRHTLLVARGAERIDAEHPRWSELGRWLAADPRSFVIDAGTGVPPHAITGAAHETGARDLLVTRPCYLSLRRAARVMVKPSGVVLVAEPDRALTARDIASSIGAPIVATVAFDPAVARAVDAGLLVARLPQTLVKPLRSVRGRMPTAAA